MNELLNLIRSSTSAGLARRISRANTLQENAETTPIILVELNHFWPNHCALPVILGCLREKKNFRVLPYIAVDSWSSEHETLQIIKAFYEAMGAEQIVIKAESSKHFEQAKAEVIKQLDFFKGPIWNLTDFVYDGIPLGVHLVEMLIGHKQVVNFEQDQSTVLYCIQTLSRYLWWKSYLSEINIEYVFASHYCYDFALPQLAALKIGIRAYCFSEASLRNSATLLPLPMKSHWAVDIEQRWQALNPSLKTKLVSEARIDLSNRVQGGLVMSQVLDSRAADTPDNGESWKSHLRKNGKRNIVVFCHAFSDAPCTLPKSEYGNISSPWLSTRQIIAISIKLGVNLYIKSHPRPMPQDDFALHQILRDNQEVLRLPNHLSIADLDPGDVDLIITGWGTVSYEATFKGLPVAAYTNFTPIRELATVPTLDLEDENSLLKVLDIFKSRNDHSNIEKERVVETYAKLVIGPIVDLTCSDLPSLPTLGDKARYSVYAYEHWCNTFDQAKHSSLNKRMSAFFEEGGSTLTSF
jgi:hypothetical protein